MNTLKLALALSLFPMLTTGQLHAKEMSTVTGANGVDLAVYESGNPEGPAILFIHGFTVNSLAWEPQYSV
ncbi:hypothetical protein [Aquisalimonas sp.]|uniref:hypothetical protein n=1 Tax=Aquisalimonas sp. TaxID=1872621 RepID=UPI0025BF9454|nr:hypothetical protein [Aquisalimonas sp.]